MVKQKKTITRKHLNNDQIIEPYRPKNKIRIVTATSLFDGHDATINVMRRILQATGCEVIHLGHDRSTEEIVNTAIQEDVQAIALTSYQGGHIEYFKYMVDLLKQKGASHIKIFGGGGGVILPNEIEELMNYGVARIYSPDDGRRMGLQGMINDLVQQSDFKLSEISNDYYKRLQSKDLNTISRLITLAENEIKNCKLIFNQIDEGAELASSIVCGITGTGGSGKSSLVDEIVRRFLLECKEKTVGIISVDPTKRKTGGALLGDRIRMNSINNSRVYMRSLATRQVNVALSVHVRQAIQVLKVAGFDLIILETSGIGQGDTQILDYSDLSLYVMTPEYGAATQLEKIDMLDFADVVAINKFDKRGAADALRDVKKQFYRNLNRSDIKIEDLPVIGTIASNFNDKGTDALFNSIMGIISNKLSVHFTPIKKIVPYKSEHTFIIPPNRNRYLSEITESNRKYSEWVNQQCSIAQRLYCLKETISGLDDVGIKEKLQLEFEKEKLNLDPKNFEAITNWSKTVKRYKDEIFSFLVRGKEVKISTHNTTLSQLRVPKIALPSFTAWGDLLRWILNENVPGKFPFTAGIYPFKREGEDPTRMFAGEGGPERTNHRFHYLSKNTIAKRLSTAFDSATLYGHDPDIRPDIYGKIGNSGVSTCCLDDIKKLYSGFNLADKMTSVSMTINGPAPIILGYFINAAIDQQCELYILENGLEKQTKKTISEIFNSRNIPQPSYRGDLPQGHDRLGLMLLGVTGDEVLPKETYESIKLKTLTEVRGTVQADILKEDQAQNTCIFSTEFALKLMGDVQQYFIDFGVRNFYSVSISGYHMAEAGANPISQLAFTLANAFTYVEYYLSRGMDINRFAPNFSFFFSNGLDSEYSVIGRVARRIWSKAMLYKYGANDRSQMLKYHIQTSGRSLHAQEIDFNDIRTTLQALYAIYDNCNSLHTNAYDEAITTPTEDSVRRALAIQLIINEEAGLAKNENMLQGSFIIEELTALVEEAVLKEFDLLTDRGGVIGAMETMYQRGKIQAESLYYEGLKHSGDLPIVGVNTFLNSKGSPTIIPKEVIRATKEEKDYQLLMLKNLHSRYESEANLKIEKIKKSAIENKNIFFELMEACKVASLGQISNALFEVGGKYRRNM